MSMVNNPKRWKSHFATPSLWPSPPTTKTQSKTLPTPTPPTHPRLCVQPIWVLRCWAQSSSASTPPAGPRSSRLRRPSWALLGSRADWACGLWSQDFWGPKISAQQTNDAAACFCKEAGLFWRVRFSLFFLGGEWLYLFEISVFCVFLGGFGLLLRFEGHLFSRLGGFSFVGVSWCILRQKHRVSKRCFAHEILEDPISIL